MPKVSEPKVFKLIRKLKRAEKRFIKIHLEQLGKSTVTLNLFDILKSRKTYNESALIRQLKLNNSNQLSEARQLLYHQILRILREFDNGKTTDITILEYLINAEILFNRGLYRQCELELNKASKKAKKYERYFYKLKINEWRRKIVLAQLPSNISDITDELEAIEKDIFPKLRSTILHSNNYLRVLSGMRTQGVQKKADDFGNLDKLFSTPITIDILEKEPPKVRMMYYQARAFYFYLTNKFDETLQNTEPLMKVFAKYKYLREDNVNIYINALNVVLLSLIAKGAYDKTQEWLDLLEKIPTKNPNEEYRRLNKYYQNKLIILFGLEDYDNIIKTLKVYGTYIDQFEEKTYILSYYYLAITAYFTVGDYDEALGWVRKLLDEKGSHVRKDLRYHTKLFELIVHFELGNYDFLQSRLDAAARLFRRHKQLMDFEVRLFKFLRNTLNITNKKERVEAFEELYDDFTTMRNDKELSVAFEYFDYIKWSSASIKSRTIFEHIKIKKGDKN